MPAPRKRITEPTTIDVGGIAVTPDEISQAIDILTSAPGIMVKQPLFRAQHPLAEADYHQIASEQRGIDHTPKAQTKPAFIAALARLAAG
jgi:hypothetical protein